MVTLSLRQEIAQHSTRIKREEYAMQTSALAVASVGLTALTLIFSAQGAAQAADKTYKIYLSNNFVGNDWRQQMLRSIQVVANKPPMAGRVVLTINNAETTVQAQINSLNNIIREKPDAILIDASSGDALNPTIERACAAGIVVVSFDQVVTADCAYKLQSNFDTMGTNQAAWMAATLSGKGNVIIDRGLAGAPVAERFVKLFEDVLKQSPGIKIVGYYNGDYSLGPEQAGVANLLAANPQIDGVLTQAYGTGAMKALQDAGRKMVPIVAAAFNGTAVACLNTAGATCVLGANPPYLSAEALRLSIDVLDGKKPAKKDVLLDNPLLTNTPVDGKYQPGATFTKLEAGKNAFPDLAPGISLPISPDWVEITAADASGSK
jgi:ribose transport system substrate-binding protein